jgi:hypothetical protein
LTMWCPYVNSIVPSVANLDSHFLGSNSYDGLEEG